MKFGYFDDKAKEYVITTPHTPLPWINYLGSNDFFSLISNTCGGYSFYKDAKLLRITRYRYNNIPADSNGKYYYINDDGVIWNPGTMPSATETDTYECRHGLGYSRFCSSKNNLKAELLVFVPSDASCEINCLKLKNNSETEKNISLFSYVEFCLWNAVDDASNFQRNLSIGEVEVQGSTIYHKTEYRERRKHYSFFTVNTQVDNYDTNRDAFLGAGNGNAFPEAVCKKKCSNSIASGWYPIAAHQIDLTLLPGEEKEFVFMLGYCENPADDKWEAPGIINKTSAKALIERFNTMEKAMQAFAELKNYWETLLARFAVVSENEHIDRMANIWNQYQCMVTFNMSRSASYYESGTGRGMGFRDSCQDLLGFVHLIPERARERIIDIASTQFPDGSAYHQYQPLTRQGNADIGSGFNDAPLWLIAAVAAYIKETGDYEILGEPVPFDCKKGTEEPLFEHLNRSFQFTVTHLGPHRLPLIGRGDCAFEIYRKICPSCIEEISDIHRTEPYVYSQMVAGADAPRFGEAKNSWLTGTAAWTFVNLSQALLGIQPEYDGLTVDPCLPGSFGDFTVERHFRGAEYHIEIHKPTGVQKGVRWIELDGQKITGNQIPLIPGKKEYHVIVQMG